jgi:hypothetical protein
VSEQEKRAYPDPTAWEAIANVMRERGRQERRWRPLVYVASPYAGDVTENARLAREHCRFAVAQGCIPLAPHLLYPQFMDDGDPAQRELGLLFASVLLGKCAELWVFGEMVSTGMRLEIGKAKKRGIPIRYFNNQHQEVHRHGNKEEPNIRPDEL